MYHLFESSLIFIFICLNSSVHYTTLIRANATAELIALTSGPAELADVVLQMICKSDNVNLIIAAASLLENKIMNIYEEEKQKNDTHNSTADSLSNLKISTYMIEDYTKALIRANATAELIALISGPTELANVVLQMICKSDNVNLIIAAASLLKNKIMNIYEEEKQKNDAHNSTADSLSNLIISTYMIEDYTKALIRANATTELIALAQGPTELANVVLEIISKYSEK